MEQSTDEDLEWLWGGDAILVSSEVGVLVEMWLGNGMKKMGDERHSRKLIIAETGENLVDSLFGNGIYSQHFCSLDGGRKRGSVVERGDG